MLRITVGNNIVPEHSVLVPETQTVREALEAEGIAVSEESPMQLNGSPFVYANFDKTFEELGIQNDSFLIGIRNLKNA